jgi:E3 UFM1-protein ligase 1
MAGANRFDGTPPCISAREAKSLASLLRKRGYFHRGAIPWTTQDALVFETSSSTAAPVTVDYDPQTQWIVETDHGLCTIDQLRADLAQFLEQHKRSTVAEVTHHLGIDEALLRTRLLLVLTSSGHHEQSKGATVHVFGSEIVNRQHIEDLVENVLEDLAMDSDATHSVTVIADSVLRVPFEMAFELMEERLLLGRFKDLIHMRRSDTGTWLLVTENYLSKLKQNLVTALTEHQDGGPISLAKLAKERSWEMSWIHEIIIEPGGAAFDDLGDFCGDVFTPRKFKEVQRQNILDLYDVNGFVSAHICQATLNVTAAAMKQYLNEVEGAVALPNSVVNQVQVVDPLSEAIKDCVDSSSWLNLGSLVPLELLEYHQRDVEDLIEKISNPTECSVWIGDPSALLLSRKFIDSFRSQVMPDVILNCARARFKEMKTQLSEKEAGISSSSFHIASKSAKEKHREREAARSQVETKEVDFGSLDCTQIVDALKARHPDMVELGDEVILRRACEDSFCTSEANDHYTRAVSKEMDQLDKRNKALTSFDNDAVLSSESGISFLCHLIQARAKFLNYASATCTSESMKSLRLNLLQTTCREFVVRLTHAALLRANISVVDFGLPPKYENVDLSCVVYVSTGSFVAATGNFNNHSLTSLTAQLSSSVAPLLIKLWKTIDTDRMSVECTASAIDCLLETANDVCLPVSGMPFSKLDKKAEKRLLCLREKHLQTQLFKTSQLDEAIDICISLLYQQAKNAVVVPNSACRSDVMLMLASERKAPTAKTAALKKILQEMSQGDNEAHLDAIREIPF